MRIVFQNLANLPNMVTAVGIILTVYLNAIFIWDEPAEHRLLILLLAVSIPLTDLDGQIARRWNMVTFEGDLLDKFRDKFFSCSIFIHFLRELFQRSDGIWSALIKGSINIILAIEFFLLLIWIIGFVKKLDISSHWAGKAKTNFYFVAIGWWFLFKWLEDLFQRELMNWLYGGLILLLFVGSFFGILSVVGYLQRYNSPPKN